MRGSIEKNHRYPQTYYRVLVLFIIAFGPFPHAHSHTRITIGGAFIDHAAQPNDPPPPLRALPPRFTASSGTRALSNYRVSHPK
jgi:hypothetical protein